MFSVISQHRCQSDSLNRNVQNRKVLKYTLKL